MKGYWHVCLLVLACCCVSMGAGGCGVRGAVVVPVDPQPPSPVVTAIPLAEITDALADEVPASVCDSDQFQLVVDDLVRAKKLTDVQASQVKRAIGDTGKVRPLTDADAALIRAVK